MKKIFLLFAAATALFASCTKDKDKSGTFKGPEVQVHNGKAWSQATLNKDGQPTKLSLIITDAALNSVPLPDQQGHDHENMWNLALHPKAVETTPFKFIMLNWNPAGHPPDHIYTLPHFDMHFFMTSETAVAGYVDPAKLNADPAADYIPALHVGADPVPQMGKHWVDVTSPELNGQTFTQTFIYGSYDSKVVFYEPMITLDFLKNTQSFDRAIPQPAKYQQSGYYPTRMKISKHDGLTEIILDGFVLRQAS